MCFVQAESPRPPFDGGDDCRVRHESGEAKTEESEPSPVLDIRTQRPPNAGGERSGHERRAPGSLEILPYWHSQEA